MNLGSEENMKENDPKIRTYSGTAKYMDHRSISSSIRTTLLLLAGTPYDNSSIIRFFGGMGEKLRNLRGDMNGEYKSISFLTISSSTTKYGI